MSRPHDLVVVGGGLIGLATASSYLDRHPSARVAVLEKERELALHQSGRNSGVVHAGLYYPAGSQKALLCRRGRSALLRFADEHAVPYEVCGKLVVALDASELPRLDELHRRGTANGVAGLRALGAEELREVEPAVAGLRALHVPETAVIDFRLVAAALAAAIESRGGRVLLAQAVVALDQRPGGLQLVRSAAGLELETRSVVCCAGLQADRLAGAAGRGAGDYRVVPFRGDFYELAAPARPLVRGLVYPVPDPAFPFLGVHFTRRIDGAVWAGPNAVPSFAREGYSRRAIDLRDARDLLAYPGVWRLARRYARTAARELWRDLVKRAAVREMQRYLPALERRDVSYGPSGMRAQVLRRDGTLVDDFVLERRDGVLHVVNAPSPAATASLAIGAWVASELQRG